jgi:glycosyltransferase involved in cell wall biosynthesis
MPVVYRLANVFVLPSTGPGETWGLAVNEAMACSRAVIVSDKCGCAQDLVHGGVNGYVFKSGDVKSLRDCMHVSLNNYRELGVNSYKIIQGYTYEETVRQLQRIDLILGPSP